MGFLRRSSRFDIALDRKLFIFQMFFGILALSLTPAAWGQDFVPGEVLVKLKGKASSLNANAFIGKAVSEKGMTLKGSWSGLNMHQFTLKPGDDVTAAIRQLKADPAVEYAEPNYYLKMQSSGSPEGPLLDQAGFEAAAAAAASVSASSMTGASIGLTQAWAAETPGLTPSVVAVIDTGIDLNHAVFVNSGALWTNTGEIAGNGIDDDHNGYIDDVHGYNFVSNNGTPTDDNGHGTHVSGIILGTTQDISNVSSIGAAKIRIMPLKFLDSSGSGSTSDAIRAIYYAINNGAKVLNNSWGGGGYSSALLDAITYAYNAKSTFVAAAGNASNNNDASPTYPANYSVPNLMSIAATTDADVLASFSNYGASSVHLASPGVAILSTYAGGSYAYLSGTSMATPFVSGVAALMVRESPSMNGYQVKNLIFGGSDSVSGLTGKVSTHSRLDVLNAVVSSKSTSVDSTQPSYSSAGARDPASEDGAKMAGCGTVSNEVIQEMSDESGGRGPSGLTFFLLGAVVLAPIITVQIMKARNGRNRRQFERYEIDSQVRFKMGDRQLSGQVSSISMGGLQLNTDEMLEKGGVVKMSIESPDGTSQIEVQGRVVWTDTDTRKSYGVQFEQAEKTVLQSIAGWTQNLIKN